MRNFVIGTAAAAALLSAAAFTGIGLPDAGRLFEKEGCIGCHRFRSDGGNLGPDLTDVSSRRSTLWIMAQIRNPNDHYPGSRMPEFSHLSLVERYSLARYLRNP